MEQALDGAPAPGLIPLLKDMNETLGQTSICGLGQIALSPLMSVIDNFWDDAAPVLGGANGNGKKA
ncbi:MAG TPA: NADH-ubiquinone oxidoreductase-F iron-sulfur binding region domain-containing protein [bacterium]